ncbi:hypothetical protein PVAP13_9KG405313 [Panicum virgatum]|uniref:Uncharacterized protein n=1 Tax=Panicum virgatum TaxID=38727 RepID=A0A8T0N813_PANVG|nr:hypothetical protein PVAP13_9KG405313 [Panicum virgatum]
MPGKRRPTARRSVEVAVEDCSIQQCRHRRPQDPTLYCKRQHRQPPRKQGAAERLIAEQDSLTTPPPSTVIQRRECGNRPRSPRNRSDGAIFRRDFFKRWLRLPPLCHSSGTRNGTRNGSFPPGEAKAFNFEPEEASNHQRMYAHPWERGLRGASGSNSNTSK